MVDLGRRAFDPVGVLLLGIMRLGLLGRRWIGNLRQAGVKPRDRFVQLAGDAVFAARSIAARCLVARRGPRDLLDLAGDRIQPLMNIGNLPGFLARQHRPIGGWSESWWTGLADGRIEPVAQR